MKPNNNYDKALKVIEEATKNRVIYACCDNNNGPTGPTDQRDPLVQPA